MTTAAVKWLALILMVVDHIAAFIPGMPLWMRYLGRCSAPLFLFALAWGFCYTRSPKRYLLRLYLAGVCMGMVVLGLSLFLPRQSGPMTSNIFPTLLLVGMIIRLKDCRWSEWLLFLAGQYLSLLLLYGLTGILVKYGIDAYTATVCVNAVFPNVIYTEGGIFIVLLGVLLDWWKERPARLTAGYLLCCLIAFFLSMGRETWPELLRHLVRFPVYQYWMVGALPVMLLYNRQRGRKSKYFFYLFYPVHLVLLYAVGWAMEHI